MYSSTLSSCMKMFLLSRLYSGILEGDADRSSHLTANSPTHIPTDALPAVR